LKINWFSNAPWARTGYGNQTGVFVPRLKALGHDVSVTAFHGLQGSVINWGDIPVYPNGFHPYGADVIGAHATNYGADIIITLMDIWVVEPENIPPAIGWYPWFPIDHEPIPPAVYAAAKRATRGITMSKFGQEQAALSGFETYYIPHGVDTKEFSPFDQQEARRRLGLPPDAFIVGMVAANKGNPPRKAFYEQIAAAAALKRAHGDVLLYLHTGDGKHGMDTVPLLEYCKIVGFEPGKDVLFCDQYQYLLGFPPLYMRDMYSAFDVLTNVSCGEGFGIPILEAQACGCPVIVGDWTSMGELCFSGWKLPKSDAEPVYTFQNSFQWQPHTVAVAERMAAAYEMRGNKDYRTRARNGALAYDANRIVEKYWKPTLERIAKEREDVKRTQSTNG
jgi:glycosyltransferase involved in cell wall biosynthesis